jgi:hypothetical protein
VGLDDAELLAVLVDDADGRDADAMVDAVVELGLDGLTESAATDGASSAAHGRAWRFATIVSIDSIPNLHFFATA